MNKSNKVLASALIGTVVFSALSVAPANSLKSNLGIENVAYADVNTNNVKLTNFTYDYDSKINTLEFTGLSSKNLGPVDEFLGVFWSNDGPVSRSIKYGDYSLEDKNGKMVVSFPGEEIRNISLVFKNLYLGVNFIPEKGEGISVDSVDVLNLESYRKDNKQMLFKSINKNVFNKKELDYIDQIFARGDSIMTISKNHVRIKKVISDFGPTLDEMEASGKYTSDQIVAKSHEFITAGLEKILYGKALEQKPQKEAPKKEKEASVKENLKKAIYDNKIMTKAAQLLLDTVPDLGEELTQKLQDLVKDSQALVKQAEKALAKLEGSNK